MFRTGGASARSGCSAIHPSRVNHATAMMNNTKLTILQINDTHGYLEPHPELFWQGDKAEYRLSGGYARLLTIFKQVRLERNGAVIALDNGDTFHGTFHAVHSEGRAFIDPVNLLGLDAWTVHWDFAYGPDRMCELAAKLNHPLLASNCYQIDTGELAYPANQAQTTRHLLPPPHTSTFFPSQIRFATAFRDRARALAFEKYLKM